MTMKCVLQRGELGTRPEPFDRLDLTASGLHRKHEAGADGSAVDEHRARPADPVLTAKLRPGQLQLVPKEVREGDSRLHAPLRTSGRSPSTRPPAAPSQPRSLRSPSCLQRRPPDECPSDALAIVRRGVDVSGWPKLGGRCLRRPRRDRVVDHHVVQHLLGGSRANRLGGDALQNDPRSRARFPVELDTDCRDREREVTRAPRDLDEGPVPVPDREFDARRGARRRAAPS